LNRAGVGRERRLSRYRSVINHRTDNMSRLAQFLVSLLLVAGLAGCCWWPPYHDHGGRHWQGDRGGHYDGGPGRGGYRH
jgi:hypothetical protein